MVSSHTKPTAGALKTNENIMDNMIEPTPLLIEVSSKKAMETPLKAPFKSEAINHTPKKTIVILKYLLII